MLQTARLTQSSTQFLHPQIPTLPPIKIQKNQNIPIPQSLPTKQFPKLSRRELTIFSNSSLLLLLGSQALDPFYHYKARAEETAPNDVINEEQEENSKTSDISIDNTPKEREENAPNIINEEQENSKGSNASIDSTPKKRAFLDISIDGEPVGRIVIGLYSDKAPFGAARFGDLLSGAAGISYRRKEFSKIMPNYVQHGGVRSYGVDAELAGKTGRNLIVDNLIDEWEKTNGNIPGIKNLARSVSIIVRNPSKPPPKIKLVARKGKLEIDQEEIGKDPNGTEFVIAVKDSPELDDLALVIGEVLEGMDVVERIGQVKTVQENTSSPYFRVAKLIGDKRAVVAERGFNRPYSKVIVSNCGLLE